MKLNMNKIAAKVQHTAYIEETRVHHDTNYRMVAIIENINGKYFAVLSPAQNSGTYYLHSLEISTNCNTIKVGDRLCQLPPSEFSTYKYDSYWKETNIEFIQELLICANPEYLGHIQNRIYAVYSCMLDCFMLYSKSSKPLFRLPFHKKR